jgi:hypothetical protein
MIALSIIPSYPLVVDSGKDLLCHFVEDPADLGKNVLRRARCESGISRFRWPNKKKSLGAPSGK